MKIRRNGRLSDDLIDRRAETKGARAGGFPMPGGAKGGIAGIVIAIVLALLGGSQLGGGGGGSSGGINLDDIFGQIATGVQQPGAGATAVPGAPDPDADLVEFVSFVLDDVQASWEDQFSRGGGTYERAKLVLFEDGVNTGGCGFAPSAVGPFYCPADKTAYLDLTFFRELGSRFNAPGDFAQAYVLAHEIGHHIQNLTGVNAEVRRLQQKDPDRANEYSVRQELQADCLAGVWAHSTYERGILESGDLDEGLAAAAAVGDDRLQAQAGAQVNSDSWTHGSSEQRQRWFKAGFDSGDPNSCDTFSGDY